MPTAAKPTLPKPRQRAILLQRPSVFRSTAPSISRDYRLFVMRIGVFKVRIPVGYAIDLGDGPGDDFIDATLRAISRRELPDLERSVHKDVVTLVQLLDQVGQSAIADNRVPVGMLLLLLLGIHVAV